MSTQNTRDRKLVEWLNEAYAKESELEADLAAHIALTEKDSYRKRLATHLTETRDHKARVGARIEALGGAPASGAQGIPGVPGVVGELAGKAVAAVKGQVGSARAVVSSQIETHLRNAQEELREEHVEIALYRRIEAFSAAVGDRETEQLARQILRDEQRMAKFLDAELGRLVRELVRSDVPRDERASTGARDRSARSGANSRRSGSHASGGENRPRRATARRDASRRSASGSRAGSSR